MASMWDLGAGCARTALLYQHLSFMFANQEDKRPQLYTPEYRSRRVEAECCRHTGFCLPKKALSWFYVRVLSCFLKSLKVFAVSTAVEVTVPSTFLLKQTEEQ